MHTVSLFGFRSPVLVSVGSTLRELGCRVLFSGALPEHERPGDVALVILEFRPQDGDHLSFRGLLDRLAGVPTVVVGPDLPGARVARLLAGRAEHSYLPINAPAAQRLELLCARLPPAQYLDLRVGPLRLNIPEARVYHLGRPVAVTTTEFRLLHALMLSPGQFIDCTTLASVAGCRSVPGHLGNLRRKLGPHAAALLRGSPARGYAIDARRRPRLAPDATFSLTHHLLHLY